MKIVHGRTRRRRAGVPGLERDGADRRQRSDRAVAARTPVAVLGTRGRTALVDQGGAHQKQFQALGVPNMNVFTKLPSVQGYGSLISTIYDNSTGTHPQAAIDPCRLADGTFTQLRLAAIAVSYAQLSHNVDVPVPPAPNCRMAPPTTTAYRYFGQLLQVHSVTVHGRGGRPDRHAHGLTFTLLDAHGRRSGPRTRASSVPTRMTFLDRRAHACGGRLRTVARRSRSRSATRRRDAATHRSKVTYELNSPMQEALDSPNWRLADTDRHVLGLQGGDVQRVTVVGRRRRSARCRT